jgi:hypothetical protein
MNGFDFSLSGNLNNPNPTVEKMSPVSWRTPTCSLETL